MRKKRNLFQSVWDLPYGRTTQYQFFDAAKNSKEFVQKLQLQSKISIHEGCVNSICWNDDGKYLLSGSDDQKLAVVQAYDYSVRAYVHTAHKANIFSAKFLPNTGDNNVISCSGDGIIIYSDLDKPETSLYNKFSCHKGTAYEIITVPHDSHTFLSCGEDRTVRWFDVRTKISCNKTDCKDDVLIHCTSPVTTLAVNPLTPYQLAVGCADSTVRIFDRRMLCTHSSVDISSECENPALMACFTVPDFSHSRRITSLCYSADGKEILVSYSSDYIYLFDVQDDLGKLPKVLSRDKCSNGGGSDSESGLFFRGRPLMKRLRIRGDWSDTGPNARPESEAREDTEPSNRSRTSVVRTMTDILARIFNNTNTTNNLRRSSSTSSHVSSQSEAVEESEEDAGDQSSENRPSPPRSTKDVSSKRKVPLDSGTSPAAKSGKTDPAQPSTSHAHDDAPQTSDNVPVQDQEGSVDVEFNQVTEELMTRRQDLVDRHHSEPMVNLHYSGQSVSSGLIRMDVANSSEANERQWLEQSISNLPDIQPQRERTPEAGPSSNYNERNEDSSSDLDSVQPRMNFVAGNEPDDDEEEVELVMEVDSWDTDDDTRHSRTRRDTLSPGSLYNFVDSIQNGSKPLEKIEESHPVMSPRVKQKYTGHRNARTMIKEATFWGDNFVMSGSDCGHIFIWDRHTAENVMLLEADHHVVNCLQPHPFDPVLASSGIDYDIKLWAPLREEPFFNREKASEIIKRNEVMLEETKDTITVPASFMFRMFTTLSHFRTGRALRWSRMAREMRAANSDSSNR